jgi:transcriptional regulator with XRE-family HTH domain
MTKDKDELIQFGARVKHVRKHLHIIQKDFARQLDISGGFLSELEAGKTKAGYDFFRNITTRFNVNPLYLFLGQGEMFMKPAAQEKQNSEETIDYGPDSGLIRQFFLTFREIPVVRFAVLEFYKSYMYNKRDMIKHELEMLKEEETSNNE